MFLALLLFLTGAFYGVKHTPNESFWVLNNYSNWQRMLKLVVLSITVIILLNLLIYPVFNRLNFTPSQIEKANESSQVLESFQSFKIVFAVIIAPICEELFFRGFLFSKISKKHGVLIGWFLSTILFALLHGNLIAILIMFITGTIFTYLYYATGIIETSIVAHISCNGLARLMESGVFGDFQVSAIPIFPVSVISAFLLFLCLYYLQKLRVNRLFAH